MVVIVVVIVTVLLVVIDDSGDCDNCGGSSSSGCEGYSFWLSRVRTILVRLWLFISLVSMQHAVCMCSMGRYEREPCWPVGAASQLSTSGCSSQLIPRPIVKCALPFTAPA